MPSSLHLANYGALEKISTVIDGHSAKKIMLITGRNSYTACGAEAIVNETLSSYSIVRFSDFDVNPKIEDAVRGARIALDEGVDLLLAIGGGSPMDIAKLIKAFMPDITKAEEMVRGTCPVAESGIPLITVPTTAGSGSEATHFAVVYIGKAKFSLASPYLQPHTTILDGQLLKSASPYQKAVNGLDALAQAIEGCWAVGSTKETQDYSFEAIKLLAQHLPAVVQGGSADDLQNVMVAANLAGRSINVSKTTAPHAFSYAFTSYHNIPHGHAVWLTLPEVFEIHQRASTHSISDPRGAEHVRGILQKISENLGMSTSENSAVFLKSFMTKIGVEHDMGKLGVETVAQRTFISEQVNAERLTNNPIHLQPETINKVFGIS